MMNSGKRQRWMFVWLTVMLSVIVFWTGTRAGGWPQSLPLAASGLSKYSWSAMATPFTTTRFKEEIGASQDDLNLEAKRLQEEKKWLRGAVQRHLDSHILLASRSMQMMNYLEYERTETELGEKVAASALEYIGTPYVWGGTSPRGFDCSGFTQYVLAQNGIQVPRNSYDQYHVGQNVSESELQPGDLVFFTTYAPGPSHLGIYIGGGKFVHALNQQTGVIASELDNVYYKSHFIGAKRIL